MRPSDPLYPDQWHHQTLNMEAVWDIELGSRNVVVAVVESGFDVEHPDLQAGIVGCVNMHEAGDGSMLSEHPTNADGQTDHGTHMLGLIGARINNDEGGVGIAPECGLLPVKIPNNLDDECIALGIRRAVDEGASIINLSNTSYFYRGKRGEKVLPRQSGPPRSDALLRACEYAVAHDVLICSIVATNQGFREISWPAAYHPGLNVIQGDPLGHGPANFASVSDLGDVMAPGGRRRPSGNPDWPMAAIDDPDAGLLSTVQFRNGAYRHWSGGCMSTAVASGIAALVRSRFPHLGLSEVQQIIRNTARGDGWTAETGFGYADPLECVRLAAVEPEPEITSARLVKDYAPDLGRGRRGPRPAVVIDLANRGVLDVRDAVVAVYREQPDTEDSRQIGHAAVEVVRGRSSRRIVVDDFNDSWLNSELWVVVDTRFQLSAAQLESGTYALTCRVLPAGES